jgi:hypothetical protein
MGHHGLGIADANVQIEREELVDFGQVFSNEFDIRLRSAASTSYRC